MELRKGDLIHIPQGVFLVTEGGTVCLTTKRPRTAIFLSSEGRGCGSTVFLDGEEFMVRTDHVYILKETEIKQNVS